MKKLTIGRRSLALMGLAVLFLVLNPSEGFALKLDIQNDFAERLSAAVVYYDDSEGAWVARGWYVTEPRQSRTINLSTSESAIYIYSFLSDREKTAWGNGDIVRVVTSDAFMYRDGEECPEGPARRTVKFTRFAAKNGAVNYRPAKPRTPLPEAGGDKFSVVRAELLKLINAERQKTGAGGLKLDETLSKAAQRRASELPAAWGHTRPDGRNYSSVFAEFGLNPARSGENVASNTKSLKASYFHEQFMNSPGHKKTLLSLDYSTVGLGFHEKEGKFYCAQLFTGGTGASGNGPAPSGEALAAAAANLINLINAERKEMGLKPLASSEKLFGAALTRAREMSLKSDISIRPDGRKFDTVLKDSGLEFTVANSSGVPTRDANALEIFQKFYNDAGCRKSMTAAEYTDGGAGIHKTADGYYTVLLLAGNPAGRSGAENSVEELEQSWKELEEAIRQLKELF